SSNARSGLCESRKPYFATCGKGYLLPFGNIALGDARDDGTCPARSEGVNSTLSCAPRLSRAGNVLAGTLCRRRVVKESRSASSLGARGVRPGKPPLPDPRSWPGRGRVASAIRLLRSGVR